MAIKELNIYTDGGCRSNGSIDALGAYAYVIVDGNNNIIKQDSKAIKNTTNNQMELLGCITALESIDKDNAYYINLYTDSQYITDTINKKWLDSWKKNNWKTSKRQPVKNQDLWLRLDKLLNNDNAVIKLHWVKGHSDNEYNNICDTNVNIAMNNYIDIDINTNSNNIINSNNITNDKDNIIDMINRLDNMEIELSIIKANLSKLL